MVRFTCVSAVQLVPALILGILMISCENTANGHIAERPQLSSQDEFAKIIKNKGVEQAVEEFEKTLERHPDDMKALKMLKRVISASLVGREESLRLREAVRQYSQKPTTALTPPNEPGEPLVLTGTVQGTNGEPIEDALIYVFHTDARGYYTHQDSVTGTMDELNARIFGYMRTSPGGRYEFRTIRPGGYPQPRQDLPPSSPLRYIPQHIHFEVTASKYRAQRFQLVFENNPRMNPEWHEWAKNHDFPLVKVTRDEDGIQRATCDIILKKKKVHEH
ncbi:hypothetical protein GWO43_06265 [candidate division KSB1 bacterium]|nr:hypothetical protein [candidate division KSB1 bacterium]NIR72378.1 hypothetical protein [candidate division KSB1 bacterium]NIS23564.1 hypothetical protein [candidate division KSB1 bacterium]NIT70493.1 hypothetical protein [candidate division KSB1 bacterium]NIU24198.1 hypothetical protein [candidate division KSB1 bacterium]